MRDSHACSRPGLDAGCFHCCLEGPSANDDSIYLHQYLRPTSRQQDGNLRHARWRTANPSGCTSGGWRGERSADRFHCRNTRHCQVESSGCVRTCEPTQSCEDRGNERGRRGCGTRHIGMSSRTITPVRSGAQAARLTQKGACGAWFARPRCAARHQSNLLGLRLDRLTWRGVNRIKHNNIAEIRCLRSPRTWRVPSL